MNTYPELIIFILNNFIVSDRDLQCDFNNMYWEESECAWTFKPTFSQQTLSSDPPFRMIRRLVDPATDRTFNYWQQKDTTFGKTRADLRYRIKINGIKCSSSLDVKFIRFL